MKCFFSPAQLSFPCAYLQSACQAFSIDEGDKSLAEQALKSMPDVWSAETHRVKAVTDVAKSDLEEGEFSLSAANILSLSL